MEPGMQPPVSELVPDPDLPLNGIDALDANARPSRQTAFRSTYSTAGARSDSHVPVNMADAARSENASADLTFS